MSSILIPGKTVPDEFESGDGYLFDVAPTLAINGSGAVVVAPYATLTMHWAFMSDSLYSWIVTTVLGGASSAEFTSATNTLKFYNHLKTLTSYTHCRIYRPDPHPIRYGYHMDVTLRITELTT